MPEQLTSKNARFGWSRARLISHWQGSEIEAYNFDPARPATRFRSADQCLKRSALGPRWPQLGLSGFVIDFSPWTLSTRRSRSHDDVPLLAWL